jgi:serine/threonine protein kinase
MSIGTGSRLDAFEIVALLGSGGMGEVWLARDVNLHRQVALKVLPPDLTQDPSRVARFRQEARAASALNHPNVSTIYALGEAPDGQQFIAMEYIEGETLRHQIGHLAVSKPLDIAVQVASALTAPRRHCPSRSQAGERDAPARRVRQGAGLRNRQAGGSICE